MSSLWDVVGASILRLEGGISDHEDDPGGLTNMGISLRAYPHLGREGIKSLTKEQALEIYLRDYWSRIPADLPDPVRWFAFDCAVHHGVGRAHEWLKTNHTVAELAATRLLFFASLSTWPHFGVGWVRRVAHLLQETNEWAHRDVLRTADVVVLHDLLETPIVLRSPFVWRVRDQKIDIKRAPPAQE